MVAVVHFPLANDFSLDGYRLGFPLRVAYAAYDGCVISNPPSSFVFPLGTIHRWRFMDFLSFFSVVGSLVFSFPPFPLFEPERPLSCRGRNIMLCMGHAIRDSSRDQQPFKIPPRSPIRRRCIWPPLPGQITVSLGHRFPLSYDSMVTLSPPVILFPPCCSFPNFLADVFFFTCSSTDVNLFDALHRTSPLRLRAFLILLPGHDLSPISLLHRVFFDHGIVLAGYRENIFSNMLAASLHGIALRSQSGDNFSCKNPLSPQSPPPPRGIILTQLNGSQRGTSFRFFFLDDPFFLSPIVVLFDHAF